MGARLGHRHPRGHLHFRCRVRPHRQPVPGRSAVAAAAGGGVLEPRDVRAAADGFHAVALGATAPAVRCRAALGCRLAGLARPPDAPAGRGHSAVPATLAAGCRSLDRTTLASGAASGRRGVGGWRGGVAADPRAGRRIPRGLGKHIPGCHSGARDFSLAVLAGDHDVSVRAVFDSGSGGPALRLSRRGQWRQRRTWRWIWRIGRRALGDALCRLAAVGGGGPTGAACPDGLAARANSVAGVGDRFSRTLLRALDRAAAADPCAAVPGDAPRRRPTGDAARAGPGFRHGRFNRRNTSLNRRDAGRSPARAVFDGYPKRPWRSVSACDAACRPWPRLGATACPGAARRSGGARPERAVAPRPTAGCAGRRSRASRTPRQLRRGAARGGRPRRCSSCRTAACLAGQTGAHRGHRNSHHDEHEHEHEHAHDVATIVPISSNARRASR